MYCILIFDTIFPFYDDDDVILISMTTNEDGSIHAAAILQGRG